MCISYILHVLPAIVIALSFIVKITRPAAPRVGIVMSILGLLAGAHLHVDHMEAMELFDPCYAYALFLAISTALVAKNLYQRA